MTNLIFAFILFLLATCGGLIFGTGNYSGWWGAVVTGIVLGGLFAARSLGEHDWLTAAVLFVGIFFGSLASNMVPDSHWFKTYLRSQNSLYVHVFNYKFGAPNKKLP